MSQDQRPAKVRAVATGSAATPATPADGEEQHAAADVAPSLPPAPAKSGSLGNKIVFLLGCAAGGAGLAALPHFVPVRF